MAGKNKIVLGRIANDAKRKLSFKRRKTGLLKKVEEFSTLCDVESAVVLYPAGAEEPTVWPSHQEASKRIERFEEEIEAREASKSVTLESYLTERVEKETKRLKGEEKKNDANEMRQLMILLSNGEKSVRELDLEELKKWNVFAGEQIRRLVRRRMQLEREDQAEQTCTRIPHFPPPPGGPTRNYADQYNLHP